MFKVTLTQKQEKKNPFTGKSEKKKAKICLGVTETMEAAQDLVDAVRKAVFTCGGTLPSKFKLVIKDESMTTKVTGTREDAWELIKNNLVLDDLYMATGETRDGIIKGRKATYMEVNKFWESDLIHSLLDFCPELLRASTLRPGAWGFLPRNTIITSPQGSRYVVDISHKAKEDKPLMMMCMLVPLSATWYDYRKKNNLLVTDEEVEEHQKLEQEAQKMKENADGEASQPADNDNTVQAEAVEETKEEFKSVEETAAEPKKYKVKVSRKEEVTEYAPPEESE